MEAQMNPGTVSCTTFKGRDIKYQRIRRHVRSKRRERARENAVAPNVPTPSQEVQIVPANAYEAVPLLPLQATPCFRTLQHGRLDWPLLHSSFLGQATPSEVILLATRSFFEGALEPTAFNGRKTNRFWHDFDTAVYLLKIGSLSRGWAAFHAMWEVVAEALVSNPFSLLRRIIAISLPNYFGPLSEIRTLVLGFIAALLEIKFDKLHPVVQICRNALVDDEVSRSC